MASPQFNKENAVKGKIGLEEHYALEETLNDARPFVPASLWPEARARLLDFQQQRIAQMDAWGMEMMLLSLNAPAIQGIPNRARAMERSVRSNNLLAGEIAKNPTRFQGLAALAMQEPDHACKERAATMVRNGWWVRKGPSATQPPCMRFA